MRNVPKFRLLPVFGSFLREYSRYCPDFNFRIIAIPHCYVVASDTRDGFQGRSNCKGPARAAVCSHSRTDEVSEAPR